MGEDETNPLLDLNPNSMESLRVAEIEDDLMVCNYRHMRARRTTTDLPLVFS